MTEDNMYNRYIKKGNSDFKVALRELSSEDPELDIACFHFQQFAEKYLKAFLLFSNINPQHTHSIPFLINECAKIDNDFLALFETKLVEINECGVEIRYDDIEEINADFLNSVLIDLLKLKEMILTKIC